MSKTILVIEGFTEQLIFVDKIIQITKEEENSNFIIKIFLLNNQKIALTFDNRPHCELTYREFLKAVLISEQENCTIEIVQKDVML